MISGSRGSRTTSGARDRVRSTGVDSIRATALRGGEVSGPSGRAQTAQASQCPTVSAPHGPGGNLLQRETDRHRGRVVATFMNLDINPSSSAWFVRFASALPVGPLRRARSDQVFVAGWTPGFSAKNCRFSPMKCPLLQGLVLADDRLHRERARRPRRRCIRRGWMKSWFSTP